MIKFRRAIAVFLLMLFTSQSVIAGFGEHEDSAHGGDGTNTVHQIVGEHHADIPSDHGRSGAPDLIDADCCHAHGHCHLLAFVDLVDSITIPYERSFVSTHSSSYHSLHADTLLRPPEIA